jgi:hypothetical protein
MQLSPWKAASCAVTQELRRILWNPKVHYPVQRSPPLVHILSQINPIHTTTTYLSKIFLRLFTRLRFRLPRCLYFSWLSHQYPTSIPILSYSCCMLCPSNPPSFDHSNYTWRRVQVMKLLIMQFSPTSCHFISLRWYFHTYVHVKMVTIQVWMRLLCLRVSSRRKWRLLSSGVHRRSVG